METLAQNISQNNFQDTEVLKLISKLNEQLKISKGKKVYGYLKADTKKTVDEIFYRLARNETINQMYSLWCEMEQQKHDVYSSAKVKFPELQDNNEFKSVKNMIIQQVMNVNLSVPEINADRLPDVDYDLDIAPSYDELIVEPFIPTNHIENEGSHNISAEQGNEYSQNLLENTEQYESEMLADTVLGLFANLSRIIADDYNQKFQSGRISVDRKVRRMIQEKKQALGQQEEHIQSH